MQVRGYRGVSADDLFCGQAVFEGITLFDGDSREADGYAAAGSSLIEDDPKGVGLFRVDGEADLNAVGRAGSRVNDLVVERSAFGIDDAKSYGKSVCQCVQFDRGNSRIDVYVEGDIVAPNACRRRFAAVREGGAEIVERFFPIAVGYIAESGEICPVFIDQGRNYIGD